MSTQTDGVNVTIPQIETSGMSDEEKVQIPLINRLDSPTAAEAKLNAMAAKGPDCMDDPEYWEAWRQVEKERGEK
jgi:hypothetical protein